MGRFIVRQSEEYKVGPGRPPKEFQFKPGQSGNPKGRKPKPPSLLPDLKKIFEQALSEKVTLTRGEKQRTLTMVETGIKQLVAQFAKGDRYARRDVFEYAEKLGIDLLAGHRKAIEEALDADHQAILESFVARRIGAAQASSARVLAPAELLDDDADEPQLPKKVH
jgi:hypothetical protein